MSILLPTTPGPDSAVPAYLDWGGLLRPIFGGVTQKLNRLGDRFALEVTLPPLESADDGRIWIAALIQAQRAGALFEFPQYTLDVGAPGSPVVDGANQAGSTINLRGFTTGYVVRVGQFFSIIHGGRRYLHMATAAVTAGSDGRATLPIAPMLRIQPSSASICEFVQPMIEGPLIGERWQWSLDYAMRASISFSIEEAK